MIIFKINACKMKWEEVVKLIEQIKNIYPTAQIEVDYVM